MDRVFRRTLFYLFFMLLFAISGSAQAHAPSYSSSTQMASLLTAPSMPKVDQTLAALYSRHSSHLPLAESSALTVTTKP